MANERNRARVVQAHRFEVVDHEGRIVAVLGPLGSPDHPPLLGLELRDRSGSPRLWLSVEEGWGPQLSFAHGGNSVLLIGVVDEGVEVVEPGPRVQLCGRDGAVAEEWRVGW